MPRRLLRDGEVVADDWHYLGEEEGTAAPRLILGLEQWLSERDKWLERGGRLGVILAPAHAAELLVPDLGHFDLIGAEFPNPGDGRGYTQARLLRERWKFGGELRATGYVRRDQLFFLARCGFNSFELPDGELEAASAALATFSAGYQPANDLGLRAALRRRHIHGGSRS